ncbi:MAG: hypothetical protein V3S64_16680 [bacterium]
MRVSKAMHRYQFLKRIYYRISSPALAPPLPHQILSAHHASGGPAAAAPNAENKTTLKKKCRDLGFLKNPASTAVLTHSIDN